MALVLLLGIGLMGFSQTKKKPAPRPKMDTTSHVGIENGPPPGSIVFVITPDQLALLNYVINESEAGHKDVMALVKILQTQQYHPPIVEAKDTSLFKKVNPPVPLKDTAVKKN